jgi:hypothetical protein
LNLYIDKIRVYDEKGLQLIEDDDPTIQITTLINTYLNHPLSETIIGWYGTDEIVSIDNYEPYRVVDNIINSVSSGSLRLHSGFVGGNSGTWSNWQVIHLFTLDLFKDEEFWLRAKPKNLQLNLYNYNYPFASTPGHEAYDPEWKDLNISYVTDTYLDRINDYDTSFAFSTQSGKWSPEFVPGESIIPLPKQINYHVNIGLMYGGKELRLDPFFSDNTIGNVGLIDEDDNETENYYFFKNTLIPRLNGWFGKTLRQIHQSVQYTKLELPVQAVYNEYLQYIDEDGDDPPSDYIDLGFFERSDEDYFMIVSRWYNGTSAGDSLVIGLDKTGQGFNNWNVTNFVDSTMQTIVVSGEFKMLHSAGDGRLFKIYPVVKDGGRLIANETVPNGTILQNDMTIDNGATLTIAGDYYANADIIVKNGYIVTTGNGKIEFQNGKKLIIEGTAIINGTSQDKLELDFHRTAEEENGIVVKSGQHLTFHIVKL